MTQQNYATMPEESPDHMRGRWNRIVLVAAGAWIVFHFLVAGLGWLHGFQLRAIHVGGALVLIFVWRGLSGWLRTLDVLLVGAALISAGYLVVNYDRIVTANWFTAPIWDRALGIAMFLCVVEAVRRTLGLFFILLISISLAYAVFGEYIPGRFGHGGLSLDRLIYSFYLGNQGITGMLVGISAGVVAMFLIFGEILNSFGGGTAFINVALRLGGRYRGGAGIVSVIASGFMGMINGSAVANVASTGVLTIPLMKRLNFGRNLSGAIESVASAGGQFMPPIMGPGAFLMAELLGIPYVTIAIAALVPSLLFYGGMLFNVYLYARQRNLEPIPVDMIPSRLEAYSPSALLALILPIAVLVTLVMIGYTVLFAAFVATLIALGVSCAVFAAHKVRTRPNIVTETSDTRSLDTKCGGFVYSCAGSISYVAMIILSAQIVVAIINLTGLGVTLSEVVISLGTENIVLSLILTMVLCIVLGMGMPTPAAYAVAAAVLATPLTRLGFDVLPTHLFLYYFACLAAVTPPVAAAIFAAVAISGGSFVRTSGYAIVLALSLYLIPFLFLMNPVLILDGELLEIVLAVLTAAVGVGLLSIASVGWWGWPVHPLVRMSLGMAALALLLPGGWTDVVGITIALTILSVRRYRGLMPERAE